MRQNEARRRNVKNESIERRRKENRRKRAEFERFAYKERRQKDRRRNREINRQRHVHETDRQSEQQRKDADRGKDRQRRVLPLKIPLSAHSSRRPCRPLSSPNSLRLAARRKVQTLPVGSIGRKNELCKRDSVFFQLSLRCESPERKRIAEAHSNMRMTLKSA